MDHEKYDKLQRDQQIGNTPDALLAAAVENRLKDVHTALPGIVQSFDPERQTAQVQPAIKRIYTTAGPVDLPMCLDVPVHFPRGGDFCITWPVAEGDECLLIFSERCIDRWFVQGNTQEPDEYRMHDLSDAFAIVGFNSVPRVIEDFQTEGIDIRGPNRVTFAYVTEEEIHIKAPTIRLSGNVIAEEGNFHKAGGTMDHDGINVGKTHIHPGVMNGPSVTLPPTPI